MPCKGRVVGLDVDFNLFFQTKLLQESIYRGDIVVVLMLSRLLRFRFDQQRATETDFMFVFNDHLQETANLLALLAQIRIQKRFITFAAAPQNIVFTAQFLGCVHGGNDLGCSPGEHFRIRVGCRTSAVTGVGKAVGGSPQQFHSGFLLFLRQHIGHYGKVIQIFLQRFTFWRDVDIMEAVIRHIEFVEEFKSNVGFHFCQRERIASLLPGLFKRALAKHIRAIPAEVMPITGGKAQMFFHSFTQHDFIRIVMTKSEWIGRFRSFKTYTIELIEIILHNELHNSESEKSITVAILYFPSRLDQLRNFIRRLGDYSNVINITKVLLYIHGDDVYVKAYFGESFR